MDSATRSTLPLTRHSSVMSWPGDENEAPGCAETGQAGPPSEVTWNRSMVIFGWAVTVTVGLGLGVFVTVTVAGSGGGGGPGGPSVAPPGGPSVPPLPSVPPPMVPGETPGDTPMVPIAPLLSAFFAQAGSARIRATALVTANARRSVLDTTASRGGMCLDRS